MKITKNDSLRQRVFDNIRENVVKERSGIHLSDLTLCLRKAYWRRVGVSPPPPDDLVILWLTGYAFQAYMYPNDREISVLIDGIHCTPDVTRGIEVKTTRQSSTRFDLSTMNHWHRQILGYCKALGKLEYDLTVMFVCGNYRPPFPSLDCWHIETTQEEVDRNWEHMARNRDRLKEALEKGIPPAIDCESWEGQYCENVGLCGDSPCARRKELGNR